MSKFKDKSFMMPIYRKYMVFLVILFFSLSLAVSCPIPDRKLRYNERSLSLNNHIEQSTASRLLFQVQLEMQQANMSENTRHVNRSLTLKYAQNIGVAYLGGIGGLVLGIPAFPIFGLIIALIFDTPHMRADSPAGVGVAFIIGIVDVYLMIPLGSTVALKYQKKENANPYLSYLGGILSAGLIQSSNFFIHTQGPERDKITRSLFLTSFAIQPLGCAIAFSLSDSYNSRKGSINKDKIGNSIGFLKPGINITPDKQMSVRLTLVEYNF
jgi:hypothetical protein